MRNFAIFSQVVCILSLIVVNVANPSWAQPDAGQQIEGEPVPRYAALWDSNMVETQIGEIVTVEKYPAGKGGRDSGLFLMVKTNKETIRVILGPEWFIEREQIKFESKDKVKVIGSRMQIQGEYIILAAEVKMGSKILKLRDSQGFPIWPLLKVW